MSLSKQIFLDYLKNGYSVFPVYFVKNGDKYEKKPLVPWKKYQEERATPEEVDQWFNQFKSITGIGMATGQVSGICVIDVDNPKLLDEYDLNSSMVVRSAFSSGFHYYYKYTEELRNTALIDGEKLDFRGDGGYVVIPPSSYDNKNYTFDKCEGGRGFLQPIPDWFKIKLQSKKTILVKPETSGDVWKDGLNTVAPDLFPVVGEGGRNNALASNIGKLLKKLPRELWQISGLPTIIAWNNSLPSPLPEKELMSTWNSIYNTNLLSASEETATSNDYQSLIEKNLWNETRIMSVEIPDDKFLVDDLIPKGCVFLSGAPKSFKSYISLHLIDCLASGKPLFNKFEVTRRRKTLVMDRENLMWSVKDRILQVSNGFNNMVDYLDIRTSFANKEFRDELISFIKKNNYEVIILDSFRRFYTGNENDSALISEFFTFIDELKDLGCSIICIHHFNKNINANGSGKIRGSSDIVAYYDANINISKKLDGGVNILELEQTECRLGKEISPFEVNVIEKEDGGLSFSFSQFVEVEKKAQDKTEEAIIDYLKRQDGYKSTPEIINTLKKAGYTDRNISAGLPALFKNHKITREKNGRMFIYKYGTDLFNKEVKESE